jgi:hypothetical protein
MLTVYRSRRKPVTVAIGIPYDEGIVFCADTNSIHNFSVAVFTIIARISAYFSENAMSVWSDWNSSVAVFHIL